MIATAPHKRMFAALCARFASCCVRGNERSFIAGART